MNLTPRLLDTGCMADGAARGFAAHRQPDVHPAFPLCQSLYRRQKAHAPRPLPGRALRHLLDAVRTR